MFWCACESNTSEVSRSDTGNESADGHVTLVQQLQTKEDILRFGDVITIEQ